MGLFSRSSTLPDEDHAEDLRTAAKAHGIFTGEMPHVVCTHPLNTPCPAPSGFHREGK
ncbi:hypothetical protein [Streptomyces sp. ISBFB 2968]|uniref:hypothetical protein n=1 Tax=Streptomyces sp. ISBFB 2968 TaxID=2903527 RepID=UPI002FDC4F4F